MGYLAPSGAFISLDVGYVYRETYKTRNGLIEYNII